MSGRRPHWDTDLEQAVSAILYDVYENGISEQQVFQAIAAVEDWQAAKPEPGAMDRTRDALHVAFGIIANARNCLGEGDPTLGAQWHEAADRFMQDYNGNLDIYIGGAE